MKKLLTLLVVLTFALTSCTGASEIAQKNTSTDLASEPNSPVDSNPNPVMDPVEIIGGDEEALREFLSSWFGQMYPYRKGSTQKEAVYIGSLPDDMPYDLPVPNEVRIIGSVTGAWTDYMLVFDTDLSAQEIREFYAQNLIKDGWREEEQNVIPGGFVEDKNQTLYIGYCHEENDAYLGIETPLLANGKTALRLNLDLTPEYNCGPVLNTHGYGVDYLLPQLGAPKGAIMQMGGSSSGDREAETTASLKTDLSPVELVEFYNQQLEAAGWELQTSTSAQADDGGGGAAWSIWKFTDEEGRNWNGSLMVLRTSAEDDTFASLRVKLDR